MVTRQLRIPKEMYDAIEKWIRKHPECGYQSVSDYAREAIRRDFCWRCINVRIHTVP